MSPQLKKFRDGLRGAPPLSLRLGRDGIQCPVFVLVGVSRREQLHHHIPEPKGGAGGRGRLRVPLGELPNRHDRRRRALQRRKAGPFPANPSGRENKPEARGRQEGWGEKDEVVGRRRSVSEASQMHCFVEGAAQAEEAAPFPALSA